MASAVERAGVAVLAVIVIVAAIGGFLGLDTDGFWLDELFTAWVIGTDHNLTAVLARALTDVHPPIYYLSAFGVSEVFGSSETALRLYSATAALGALLVFAIGTRDSFTFTARLFAVAVAMGSTNWFLQSHFARSNSLAMLIAAVLLMLALRLVKHDRSERPASGAITALTVTMLVGPFVHFYLLFVDLAVLATLFIYCPRRRWFITMLGFGLTLAVAAYVKLVLNPRTVMLLDKAWIGNDLHWYLARTSMALLETSSWQTGLTVALCTAVAAVNLARMPFPRITAATLDARLICVAVPILVALAGIASSLLSQPNYTDRNVLIASPFLWGVFALIYDVGVGQLGRWRAGVTLLAAILLLPSATRVADRFRPYNTPFRGAAEWVLARPGCRGRTIPVLIDRMTRMKPGQAEMHARHEYGHYLAGQAGVSPVYVEDIMAGSALPHEACGIVGWATHYVRSRQQANALQRQLSARLGIPVTMTELRVTHDPDGMSSAYIYTLGRR